MEIAEIYSLYSSCTCLCTDTRKISEGCFFVALKGETFDGNTFALDALARGAKYALVSEEIGSDPRLIKVEDTLKTLQALAIYHREVTLKDLPIIGLTGTNGKTTTKELIRAVLAAKYNVRATVGNLNNAIGVPVTILSFTPDLDVAVVELGASHPGDIDELTPIAQPNFGLITNVGRAHLLGFGSFEGVQKTKGELYDYLKAHGGKVFYNEDDETLCKMVARRGLTLTHPYSTAYTIYPEAALAFDFKGRKVQTRLIGRYNLPNVIAAITLGEYFGVPVEDCIAAVEAYEPTLGRSEYKKTANNEIIADAYNANPSSMAAALDNFDAIETSARKVVFLGEMLELGEYSLKEHLAIVLKVAGMGCDACFVGEEFAKAIKAAALDFPCFATSEELSRRAAAFSGCIILVKGSRGTRMERVFEAL
ncbi:MAG: UDP-N-acetylmuramoyl-tripeptide--D-alanyl-D-alanine ligase [Bacteroidales bacterium]|nr:UDP-N-acetylmuramoyl-tripeptide--D-alanyl-D-alanine ligase [Bacteroidales bacterium]